MTRVLVLGSTGMLGHMALKVFSKEQDFEVKGTDFRDFDAEAEVIVIDNYDYVINCIGVLAPITDVKRAIKVNALFPHKLAESTKAKIFHISTDGVFSGAKESYDEDAPHDCLDAYGKTKSLGEVVADNVINIRTSIIGPSPYKKKGLLEWFLSQPNGVTIQGFTNHVWHGVTTLQYAELCVKFIKQDAFDKLRQESPTFHFAPNQPLTKYELLQLFKSVFGRNINVDRAEDPRGSVERVLKTKYEGIKKLFPHGITMRGAVEQLKQIINS